MKDKQLILRLIELSKQDLIVYRYERDIKQYPKQEMNQDIRLTKKNIKQLKRLLK